MKIESGLVAGQVLQRIGGRGATALVRGRVRGEGPITATLTHRGRTIKGWECRPVGAARQGVFRLEIEDLPVGGPYQLALHCHAECAKVSPLFVGDVWVLAGQSNMQGVGNLEGAAQPHPWIRALSMRREWQLARDPLHVLQESPDICHNGGVQLPRGASIPLRMGPKGTGLGIFFARERMVHTGVPQGLICTAHGGTSMQQWSPALKKNGPASLYASMLDSVAVTGQPVAGVLWYQGESDANEESAGKYTERMIELVRATRRDLRLPKLPWVVVQIARHFVSSQGCSWWNSIQEQQRLLPKHIRCLETVAAIDLPMDDCIHVGAEGLARLGVRLAQAARFLVDGMGDRPPQLDKIRQIPSNVLGEFRTEIRFRHVQGSLKATGEASGFSVVETAGEAPPPVFHISLHGQAAHLHHVTPLGSAKIGYGLGLSPVCNITDARGYSLPVFGPVPVSNSQAFLPFVTRWSMTDILPIRHPLRSLTAADLVRETHVPRADSSALPKGFVNEHECWVGKCGQVFFAAALQLPEAMTLRFLMGYDGPFALWVGGQRLFLNESGTNPALPDASAKTLALPAGRHEIRVAMDIANGLAWGFYLRFERRDLTKRQRDSGDFLRPDYLSL